MKSATALLRLCSALSIDTDREVRLTMVLDSRFKNGDRHDKGNSLALAKIIVAKASRAEPRV